MGPLSGFFTRNWTLKLSALGLALLLWIAVRVEAPNRQEVSGVPVRVDLSDPGWALTGPPTPTTVQVRFAGPSRELLRMAMDRPTLVVPLDQVATGDTTVTLRTQWVRVQDRAGVVVENIQPAMVRLHLEPVERIALPPALRFTGELPDGLALSAPPVSTPGEIRVSGPRSRILGMDSVPLRTLDLATLRTSGVTRLEVSMDRMEGLQFVPTAVEVELRLEDRVDRMVSGVPIILGTNTGPDGLELIPSTATVRLSGARSLLEFMDPTALRLEVDRGGRDWPSPGEESRFTLRLHGLPLLVEGTPDPLEAVVRRPGGENGNGEGG